MLGIFASCCKVKGQPQWRRIAVGVHDVRCCDLGGSGFLVSRVGIFRFHALGCGVVGQQLGDFPVFRGLPRISQCTGKKGNGVSGGADILVCQTCRPFSRQTGMSAPPWCEVRVASSSSVIFSFFEEFFRFFHTLSCWKQRKEMKFGCGAHRERERVGAFWLREPDAVFLVSEVLRLPKSWTPRGTGGLPRGCQPFTPSAGRRRGKGDSPIFAGAKIGTVPASLARWCAETVGQWKVC